jgi:hypothetical protein
MTPVAVLHDEDEALPRPDYRDRYEALTGISLRACPVCHQGRMRVIERLAAGCPAIPDTS